MLPPLASISTAISILQATSNQQQQSTESSSTTEEGALSVCNLMGLRCDLQYAIRNWQWHRGVERLIKRNLQLQSRGCISNKLHSE